MCILIDQLEERLDHFDRVAGSQSIDIPERKRILYPSPFIFSRYSNASYVVLLLITLVPPLILQMIILKQAFKFVIFTYYLDELAFALFVVTICLCGSVWLIMRRFKSLIHRALVGVAATVLWTIYYQL